FTALSNQFFTLNMNAPIANLPVVIFQYAASPFKDWNQLAWAGALVITAVVLLLNSIARRLSGRNRAVGELGERMPSPVASEDPPKLKIRDLSVLYGDFQAVHDVTMHITEERVTAFIGPSGCGKSTLLRTFNRMFELYPGQRAEVEILMDGENLLTSKTDVSLIRARVGMVFQKPTPFPMSIYDNIAFGVRL